MTRKLIVDGNAVYEVDEECMQCEKEKQKEKNEKNQERRNGINPNRKSS